MANLDLWHLEWHASMHTRTLGVSRIILTRSMAAKLFEECGAFVCVKERLPNSGHVKVLTLVRGDTQSRKVYILY